MKITIASLINMFYQFGINIKITTRIDKGYIFICNIDNDKDHLFYSLEINEILVDNDTVLCSVEWMNMIEEYINV
jgi:hypothetical protein